MSHNDTIIIIVIFFNLKIPIYFFYLCFLSTLILFPYAYKCKHLGLIDNFSLHFYWSDFKPVLLYSLAIFSLSIFQMTATQSRPIILGIFSKNAAVVAAEYRIVEVFPSFIILVGGVLSTIFLPKTSELVEEKNDFHIKSFAYRSTLLTSILSNILCVPFILGSSDIIMAYVGNGFLYLSKWLILWVITVLIQIHTTPANALILSVGKTKMLVFMSAISCALSIGINIFFTSTLGVGSAIVGYCFYVLIIISSYYLFFYDKILGLSRLVMFKSFLYPTLLSFLSFLFVFFLPFNKIFYPIGDSSRFFPLLFFLIKSVFWFFSYIILLRLFRIVFFSNHKLITLYDKNM